MKLWVALTFPNRQYSAEVSDSAAKRINPLTALHDILIPFISQLTLTMLNYFCINFGDERVLFNLK